MTATDTAVEPAAEAPAGEAAAAAAAAPTGLTAVVGSGDHKVTGRLFIGFSFAFLLVALGCGELLGIERIDASGFSLLSTDTYGQVFTLYRVSALFLFLWPLLVGLALVVVPLQVGAPTVAFPRAAAAAFWGWLVGSGLVLAAYAANGGPGGGDPEMVDLFALGFGIVVISLLLATVCLVTTVATLRAEGMAMGDVPLFSWSIFAAGTIWLLSFSVLIANLAVFYVDHAHGGRLELGTNVALYPELAWAFAPPQLFVLAVPLLGLAGDAIPVFARTRPRSHEAAMVAIGLAAVLSFGAAFQPFFAPEITDDPLYVLVGFAAVLPFVAVLGLVALTFLGKGGKVRLTSGLVLPLLALLLVELAVLAGAVRVVDALDLIGTSFETGIFDLVVYAGVIAGFGGLAYWAAKVWGGRLPEGAVRGAAALAFLGALVSAVPDLITGLLDQPDLVEEGTQVRDGVEALNAVSFAGTALVGLAVLVLLVVLLAAVARRGRHDVGEDPWDGHTLEWASPSPPPLENFTGELPEVTSDRPLLDARTSGEEA